MGYNIHVSYLSSGSHKIDCDPEVVFEIIKAFVLLTYFDNFQNKKKQNKKL